MSTVGAEAISAREADVLEALGDHRTNAEIAQQLHISVRTVESHVSSLLRKLGAVDRRELAAKAADLALAGPVTPRPVAGLPTSWTSFVGRTTEVEEVAQALTVHRLVTLAGPGGVGKTRLATVVAGRVEPAFPGGGAFVDLVPVTGEFVVRAAAAALGVTERPQTPLETVVHERLRDGRTLLLLDNCEHVLDAVVAFASGVLAACPEAVILVTTRERLGLPGEHLIAVQPLGSDAEALFVDRAAPGASALEADPALVAEVCARLDGMPLAIELAAARIGSLGVDGLLAGLDDHLRLLSRSSDPAVRHRSLRTVIDWSHDLLDDEERGVFRRLAVFAGTFDLASAAAVAGDGDTAATSDVIGRLADKSLLVHRRDGAGSRWRMLDTVHAYANERLEAHGERDPIRARHLAWAASTARALEGDLDGPDPWFGRFDVVADDLRLALAGAPSGADTEAYDLGLSLGHLTYARGFLVEARQHYRAAVTWAPDAAGVVVAETHAADVAFAEMRGDSGLEHLLRAAAAAEEAGDAAGAAVALASAATLAARAPATFDHPITAERIARLEHDAGRRIPDDDLPALAHVAVAAAWRAIRVDVVDGRPQASEALALARRLDDPVLLSNAFDAMAGVNEYAGHYKESSRWSTERLGLLDRLPRHDPRVGGEVADIYHMVTESAAYAGELPAALAGAQRARDDQINAGLPYLASSRLVIPLALQGAFDDALLHATAMRDSWERAGRLRAGWMAVSVYAAALIHGLRGDSAAHAEWWDLAEEMAEGTSSGGFAAFVELRLLLHREQVGSEAVVPQLEGSARSRRFDGFALATAAEIAVVAGAPEAEDRMAELGEMAAENDFIAAGLTRAAGRLHGDEAELEAAVVMWEAIGARFERACTLVLIPSRAEEGRRELEALGCAQPPR